MDFKTYQQKALRTLDPNMTTEQMADMAAFGIVGEAGELLELFKKHLFHGKPLVREAVLEECGDLLWYVAVMAKAQERDVMHPELDFDKVDQDGEALSALAIQLDSDRAYKVGMRAIGKVLGALFSGNNGMQANYFLPVGNIVSVLRTLSMFVANLGGINAVAQYNIDKLEGRYPLPPVTSRGIAFANVPKGDLS